MWKIEQKKRSYNQWTDDWVQGPWSQFADEEIQQDFHCSMKKFMPLWESGKPYSTSRQGVVIPHTVHSIGKTAHLNLGYCWGGGGMFRGPP